MEYEYKWLTKDDFYISVNEGTGELAKISKLRFY